MGMGMGMGFAIAQQMGQAMAGSTGTGAGPGGGAPAGPPPIPQPVSYFLVVGGRQAGPFGLDILRQQVGSGQLTGETLVWRQGMAEWTKASNVADLQPLFSSTPPPIPPPLPD